MEHDERPAERLAAQEAAMKTLAIDDEQRNHAGAAALPEGTR
jgi:hypothetical protein